MRIFYSVFISGQHNEYDLLSVGMAAENGVYAYAENNYYSQDKIDKQTDRDVVSQFLGEDGIKDLIADRPGTKAISSNTQRVGEFMWRFLDSFGRVELIGRSTYFEAAEIIKFMNFDSGNKFNVFVDLPDSLVGQYENLFNNVAKELPEGNALRHALFIKHLVKKHERSKEVSNK